MTRAAVVAIDTTPQRVQAFGVMCDQLKTLNNQEDVVRVLASLAVLFNVASHMRGVLENL